MSLVVKTGHDCRWAKLGRAMFWTVEACIDLIWGKLVLEHENNFVSCSNSASLKNNLFCYYFWMKNNLVIDSKDFMRLPPPTSVDGGWGSQFKTYKSISSFDLRSINILVMWEEEESISTRKAFNNVLSEHQIHFMIIYKYLKPVFFLLLLDPFFSDNIHF